MVAVRESWASGAAAAMTTAVGESATTGAIAAMAMAEGYGSWLAAGQTAALGTGVAKASEVVGSKHVKSVTERADE